MTFSVFLAGNLRQQLCKGETSTVNKGGGQAAPFALTGFIVITSFIAFLTLTTLDWKRGLSRRARPEH